MATHKLFIPPTAFMPDTTGGVFLEPYSVKATNDKFQHLVLIFNDSNAVEGAYAQFHVPNNYVGSAKFTLLWTSTATTNDIKMDLDYRCVGGNDTESLDQATYQESLTLTDTAPSAANERMEVDMSAATAGNFAAGDLCGLFLTRESNAGADTMAAAAIVHGLIFEYADA